MPGFASWLANRSKLGMPGLAGRLAIVTGLLVTLAVGLDARRRRPLAALARRGSRRSRASSSPVSAAREGIRQSAEDVLTAARIARRASAAAAPAARLASATPCSRSSRAIARAQRSTRARSCKAASCSRARRRRIEWDRVLAAATEQGERFLVTGAAPRPRSSGASGGRVAEHEGVSVLIVRRTGRAARGELTERAGVEIRIVDYALVRAGRRAARES